MIPDWTKEAFDLMDAVSLDELERVAPELVTQMSKRQQFVIETVAKLDKILAGPTEAQKPDEIMGLLYAFGSNARLQFLVEYYPLLSDRVLRELTPQLWTDPNMLIGGPRGFTREIALDILNRTGFLSDCEAVQPEGEHTIYHGVYFDVENPPCCTWWDGMCWTSDLAVAKKFARCGLLSGKIDGSKVLARFDGRNESEWVVDPLDVEEIERKTS